MSIQIIGDRGDWKKIDSSLVERLNREAEAEPRNPTANQKTTDTEPEQGKQDTFNVQDLNGYIYVPSIKLYVAKNRDLNGLKWNQAVDEIYKKGITVEGKRAEMPTPFEFMSYVKYLLSGKVNGLAESERKNILDDILKLGNYRGNWLNAKFVKNSKGFNGLGMEIAIFNSAGKADTKIEPLEQCLWQDCWADINSGNNQGLLTKQYGSSYKQGKNVYFWYPRETAVAGFDADSGRADLACDRDAGDSYPSLGVRFVVRAKNLGGVK